jgi:hypothetical protein
MHATVWQPTVYSSATSFAAVVGHSTRYGNDLWVCSSIIDAIFTAFPSTVELEFGVLGGEGLF